MKVVKMPEDGSKFIPYEIEGNSLDLNEGDLMFNVSKKERDYEVTLDICEDYTGSLVMGTDTGERYVAQVIIPAREYIETEVDNPEYHPEMETEEGMNASPKIIQRDPVPFSMDKCTLILWEMEV